MADRRSSLVGFVLLLFLLLFQSAFGQLSSAIEQAALLDLRGSLGLRAKDWPRKVDPCSVWFGVQCRQDGRVIGINISGLRRTRVGRLNPQFSVDALANLTLLSSFNASGFSLPGSIPEWFGQLLPGLQVLDLRTCSVSGNIPSSLGNLTNLNSLYLSGNNLTGVIPSTLGQLSRLSVLDLSMNSFTGFIPPSFSSLSNLTLLDLSSNSFSGTIPPSLGTFPNLRILNLSKNSFSSSIPVQLGDLSRLVDLDLGFNSLSGSLPSDLRGLRSLQKMVVGDNALSGSLPDNLFSSLSQLQFVVLRNNSLSGALPDLLWSMPQLLFLDVSYNNFSGVLPNLSSNANASAAIFNLSHNQFYGTLASQFRRFDFIDLSDNYFEGRVSEDTSRNSSLTSNCLQNLSNQRSLEDCTAFYAARGLIFDNFGLPNTTPLPAPSPARKNNRRLKFILVGVFGGLGFVLLVVGLLVLCLCVRNKGITDQRGRGVGPAPVGVGGSPPPAGVSINYSNLGEVFSYEQLLKATGDFGDLNLIKHGHSGDLFRGVLENGTLVVIKRVNLHSTKKDSYMVELELFSRASHTRLVSLLGHCLEHENDKFLVYKYMPNGDLSNSLYRKTSKEDDSLQSLDWITRLKIAIGAAEGLSYLHHECSPPLVHRDIQASSILLDDKFEVRLGSLSEVSTQEGDTHQNMITRLLRLPQTTDQGPSSSPSATCAYDVYCFGKILLELVTGKLGISASNDTTTNEWLEQILPYISIYERELVTKIVDPSLIVDEDLLEEVWAMAIVARSCLNPKPSKRPLMRYILKALENPLKVVREDNNSNSARLITAASSRGSWNAALFGSWRHSSSDIVAIPGQGGNKEGGNSFKHSLAAGSQGSAQYSGYDHSSSNKKLSRDIFPEPVDLPATERSAIN
ncbi:Protein kinase domain [Macleaya cordata]|uniref:Protein kinase domain n=1 Tax=Macleaya cordata TaxID=56857 RepID=A0A200Q977_MACCD|nr:Protein kinase domain [Macleaya cordata]